MPTGLCGKTSVCLVMQLTRKSTLVMRYVKHSFYEHDKAQRIQAVFILLHEEKLVLGLFCLHLNTVGWRGHVQECSSKKEAWERIWTQLVEVVMCKSVMLKRDVGMLFPHQMKRKATPKSSNKVSISLQLLLHWILLFHCRLLTSSASLHVASTSVRSQPCFNVIV